ncbi:MAG TPA: exo-alpha-sialidase [Pseudonocardiaceae bacterium]|nr:exo-alpha-sialidase [Pseudonocardiaceae bacterium]
MRVVGGVLGAVLGSVLLAVSATTAGADQPARHVLYDHGSFYPRAIRLARGPDAGLLVASLTTNIGRQGVGIIEVSTTGGQTFQQVAEIRDPTAANGGSVCCGALYELPTAVGDLPAGTVLWAASTGNDAPRAHRISRERLWASTDGGLDWRFVSTIATATNHFDTWEPSLSVAANGQLVAFYSDETDYQRHDQKLVQVRSADGVHWGGFRETVVSDTWTVRPGMANVIRLPDHSYFMSYEVCNNDFVHLCGIYDRRSTDGWNYGNARNLGTSVRTVDGKYLRHTPFPVWTPGPGPNGTILLIGEMVVNADGGIAPENGKTLVANGNLGRGPWYEIPAPIAVTGVNNTGCKNFSPALVPSADGTSLLEVDTDLDHGVCKTYYASEPLHT